MNGVAARVCRGGVLGTDVTQTSDVTATRPSPRAIASLWAERRAITAVEYGIVAAFLCLSLLGIFRAFGNTLTSMFSGVSTTI